MHLVGVRVKEFVVPVRPLEVQLAVRWGRRGPSEVEPPPAGARSTRPRQKCTGRPSKKLGPDRQLRAFGTLPLMQALVTGGAGFIGSHVVDALVERGDSVRVLDDLSSGFAENVNPKAELIEAEVSDEAAVAQAVAGVEVVFHQAAHRAVLRSVEHPLETDP